MSHFRFAGSSDLLIEITQPFSLAKCRAKFLIKENQRITHNSIFADFAHLGFHTSCVPFEIRNQNCQRSTVPSGTRQNPTRHSLSDRLSSTLSQEELQPHAWGRTAYRGTHNIRGCMYRSSRKSTEFLQNCSWERSPRRFGFGALAEIPSDHFNCKR